MIILNFSEILCVVRVVKECKISLDTPRWSTRSSMFFRVACSDRKEHVKIDDVDRRKRSSIENEKETRVAVDKESSSLGVARESGELRF